jgi:hypothetical protein
MGIERAATRWYLQRIIYESEIATLEAKLKDEQNNQQRLKSNERAETEKQLADALSRLHALGPCPKAMMG